LTVANLTTPPSPLPMSSLASFLNSVFALTGRLAALSAGVNFNVGSADTAVSINLPTGYTQYVVTAVRISGASGTLTTATIGVFGATGGGNPVIAASQAITVSTGAVATNNNTQSLTLTDGNTRSYNLATLYIRIGTAQGNAATANVTIEYTPVP
jgi:hypothetical protein